MLRQCVQSSLSLDMLYSISINASSIGKGGQTNVMMHGDPMCPIQEDKQSVTIQEDKSMIGVVAQCYQYNVSCQGECSYQQGSGPMLFVHIM